MTTPPPVAAPPERLGPLYVYDLLRLARRGRSFLLRFTYGLGLLVFLYFAYEAAFPGSATLTLSSQAVPGVPLGAQARFAERFIFAFMAIQGLAVLILTPAYLAGAISEEKERRTLELLFTTHLTDWEIVTGKTMARATHLAAVLLVGLPVVLMAQAWGGVSLPLVLACWIATFTSLISVGAVCMTCSVFARSVLGAVLMSYFFLGIVCGVFAAVPIASPVSFQMWLAYFVEAGAPWGVVVAFTATYVGVHLAVSVALLWFASSALRRRGMAETRYRAADTLIERPLRPLAAAVEADPTTSWRSILDDAPTPAVEPVFTPRDHVDATDLSNRPKHWHERGQRPPVDEADPLLWKEEHHAENPMRTIGMLAMAWFVVAFLLVAALGISALVADVTAWHGLDNVAMNSHWDAFLESTARPMLHFSAMAITFIAAVGASFSAVQTILHEREQRTLEALLMLPTAREQVLAAKWLGSLRRVQYLLLAAVWFIVLAALIGAIHPAGALVMMFAMAVHLMFLVTLALWLSIACRTSLWGYFTMALMLMVVFLGSVLISLNTASYQFTLWARYPFLVKFYQYGLNPMACWWQFGFNANEWTYRIGRIDAAFPLVFQAVVLGLGVFLALTAALWWECKRRFRADVTGEGWR
jgi:ABC-type transport system involved in multi-copper enzyme maturation permease subunit